MSRFRYVSRSAGRAFRFRFGVAGWLALTGLVRFAGAQTSDVLPHTPSVAAVSVSVTSAGRPVIGLEAGDFIVIENGARVEVGRMEGLSIPLNVAIVVDPSPAGDLGLDRVRGLVSDLIGGLDPASRVAIIEAQSPVRDFVPLTEDRARLGEGVAAIESTGRPTNRIYDRTVDAFLMLLDEGTPRGAVVVLTDGIDVGSDRGEETFLRAVRVAGLPLHVLATDNAEGYSGGLGVRAETIPGNERLRAALSNLADQSEQFYFARRERWRERASSSGGAFVEVGGDAAEDARATAGLATGLNSTYTLYFLSSGPPPGGGEHTAIEVRVDRPDVEVRAPTGIWWPEP
jgi:hypothetical protein